MVKNTNKQLTPYDVAEAIIQSAVGFVAGMGRLSALLYERNPDAWREFETFRREFELCYQDMDYEGIIDLHSDSREALSQLSRTYPNRTAELKRMLASADQLLGRTTFIQAIAPSDSMLQEIKGPSSFILA